MVVFAGQLAYAEAYKYVYYVSIAFGAVSIIAACFLGDINKYSKYHYKYRWTVVKLILAKWTIMSQSSFTEQVVAHAQSGFQPLW